MFFPSPTSSYICSRLYSCSSPLVEAPPPCVDGRGVAEATPLTSPSICSYTSPSSFPAEIPVLAPSCLNFGRRLLTAISTSIKMAMASRAVRMAVMTEAMMIDVEQEGHTSHWFWFWIEAVVAPDSIEVEVWSNTPPV